MFNAISMRPVPTAGDFPNHFRIAARTSSFMPRFPGLTRCAAELWEAWVMTGENGSRHPKVTGQALFDLFGW